MDGRQLGAVTTRARRLLHRATDRFRSVTIPLGPAAGLRIGRRFASNDYGAGTVELPVQQALAELVTDGSVFFDVGANVGFFSLVASAVTGGDVRIYAFEPRHEVADALRANFRRNRVAASVWEVAVGDRDGSVDLLVGDHPGGATISPDKAVGARRHETVRQVTIDSMVAAGRLPVPDVVKIDVEGAEPEVLRGMVDTLRRGRPVVVFEIDAPTEADGERQFAEVDAILSECGYTCRRLERSYEDTGWYVVHAVAAPSDAGSDRASGPPPAGNGTSA